MRAIRRFAALPVLFLAACSSGGGAAISPVGETGLVFVSSFTPSAGGVGTLVTVEGSHFGKDPFAVSVRFNGLQGTPGTVQLCTEDRILVTVPPGSSTGKIAVLAPAGTFLTESSFTVFPTVTSLQPPSPPGAPVGALVEILGHGFDGSNPQNNAVSFAGVPATILDGSSSSLIVSVPVGAKTGSLLVSAPSGVVVQPYVVQPSITGYSLDYGLPGSSIAIAGFNFAENPAGNAVAFHGVPATVNAASYSSLEVVVPAGFATGAITVTTSDGVAVGPDFYLPTTPSIAGFQPISGVAGEVVTIQGAGFLPGATTVKFQGVLAAVVASSTGSLDAIVPAGASTGPIEVSHPFGSASSAGAFTVLQPPAIHAVSPAFAAWGGEVTIDGADFDPDPAGNEVRFGGVLASVTQASPGQIVTTVPQGASSGPITVETAAGIATSPGPFQVPFVRYAVVANAVEETLAVYEADAILGQLRHRSFVSTGSGSQPSAVALDASGSLAFVASRGQDSLSAYRLGADGFLSHLQTVPAGDEPSAVAVHPSGSFVFAANRAGSSISVYAVGGGGSLSAVETRGTGREPLGLVLHPSGSFAYCANSQNSAAGNSITVYAVDPVTGSLTLLQRKAAAAGPRALIMHPTGNWLYGASADAGSVQVFQIDPDGRLALQQTVSAGTSPVALAADPYFRFLFVANRDSNDLSTFAIQPDGGLSSLGGSVSVGAAPSALGSDFSGKLFVTNEGADEISIFSISSSGSLQSRPAARTHRGPSALALAAGVGPVQIVPQFAFVANTFTPPAPNNGPTEKVVLPFQIAANGSLAVSSGGGISAGPNPASMAVDPLGSFLYTANRGSAGAGDGISMFLVGADGSLVANGAVDAATFGLGLEADFVEMEISGQFLFSARGNFGATHGNVGVYRIDRSPGNLGKLVAAPGSPLDLNSPTAFFLTYPVAVSGHPLGRFFYVLEDEVGSVQIETFEMDLETGAISSLPGGILGVPISGTIAVHPSGRFLYRTVLNTKKLFVHPLAVSGAPGAALPQSFDTGTQSRGIAFTPDGRRLFLANSGDDSVSAYEVDLTTGLLARIDANPAAAGVQDFPVGNEPFGLSVERSGKFLYVTNSGDCGGAGCVAPNSVSMLRIETDGSLAQITGSFLTGESPKAVATVCAFQ